MLKTIQNGLGISRGRTLLFASYPKPVLPIILIFLNFRNHVKDLFLRTDRPNFSVCVIVSPGRFRPRALLDQKPSENPGLIIAVRLGDVEARGKHFVAWMKCACEKRDGSVGAYGGVILSDINLMPPLTNLTFLQVTTDPNLSGLFYFGVSVMTDMFMQMRAGLEDFQYNDNGLSLAIDQVGKLNASIANLLCSRISISIPKTFPFPMSSIIEA